jgi:hypothetical protein
VGLGVALEKLAPVFTQAPFDGQAPAIVEIPAVTPRPLPDRQANRALHTVVLLRLRRHDATRACMERRLAEGKTKKEVIRCRKRYAAREIYAILSRDQIPVAA